MIGMSNYYRVCSRCVMYTSDPEIDFDVDGVCSHCRMFDKKIIGRWFPDEKGSILLDNIVDSIKFQGKNRKYDCIIGLSGGVDSSYLALKVKELGLRALALHVDAGWNSELAVNNIENIINYCNFDLYTEVIDWDDMRRLQLAYMRSGIANQDVPQDHAFFASIYRYAAKNNIKYVLSGGNIATESVFPSAWYNDAMDARSLKAIFRTFGEGKLRKYPIVGFWKYYFYYPFLRGMKVVRPLNYLHYNREEAISELQGKVNWKHYGGKHNESIFTKFFQNYYEHVRFGYDMRRPHLSSEILSGQITREKAISVLSEPLYTENELDFEKNYIMKKLRLSKDEFDELLSVPARHYSEFPNNYKRYVAIKRLQAFVESLFNKKIICYS